MFSGVAISSLYNNHVSGTRGVRSSIWILVAGLLTQKTRSLLNSQLQLETLQYGEKLILYKVFKANALYLA